MKDFAKSVRTGNANVEGVLGSQYTNPNSAIAQEIYREYISSGKNKEKALVNLVKKHPSHDSKTMEKAIDVVVEAFEKRTLNESIDKQEWSMFQGLKKDAEKEIGNKAIVLKDGNVWVVLYANETKSQEFESEAEAREFAKKVGNADKVSEYNAEIQRLTKKAEQLRRMGQGRQAMEVEKQIEKLGKEMRELGNKKTGNALFSYEDKARIAKQRYLDAKSNKDYPQGVEYEKRMAKDHINHLNEILQKIKSGKMDSRYEVDEKDVEKAISIYKQIGNEETKAERKFGKVMGEFEEGALKTPQGKTVTDPAQAKAIAYSEADKVDNLKRARNAMKK